MWMQQADETDRVVRERFGGRVAEAAAAEWDVEALSREEAVGLVVLLDQFPRNIHRTTGEAFAHDAKAREVARRLIAGGLDRFGHMERFLITLPFQHNEDVADQDYVVMLTAELAVKYADLVYNGLWYTPTREAIDALVRKVQEKVTGVIRLKFFKGDCRVVGRQSPHALYDHAMATYDEGDKFDHTAGEGFVKIWGLPLEIAARKAKATQKVPAGAGKK